LRGLTAFAEQRSNIPVQSISLNLRTENVLENDCTQLKFTQSAAKSELLAAEIPRLSKRKHKSKIRLSNMQPDLQIVGFLGVQVVPTASFGACLSRGLHVCRACTSRAGHETALRRIRNRNRRTAALLLQHCFNCAHIGNINTTSSSH